MCVRPYVKKPLVRWFFYLLFSPLFSSLVYLCTGTVAAFTAVVIAFSVPPEFVDAEAVRRFPLSPSLFSFYFLSRLFSPDCFLRADRFFFVLG